MDTSTFNVESFASSQFEGANDTRYLRIEPKEYNAVIVGPLNEKGKTGFRTSDKGYVMLDVVWQPDDEEQRIKLGLDRLPTVRQTLFLDMTPQGGLDMGPYKNGELGRLQKAIGIAQNPGERWSFADFIGRPARIKAELSPNEKDPANPYMNVKSVAHI